MTAKDFFYKNVKATYQDCISPDECIKLMNEYHKHIVGEFVAPSMEDVVTFFQQKTGGSQSDGITFASKFIAHYELKDWKYGNKKLKDWRRAAVAAWDMSKFVTTKTINNGTFGKGTSSEGLQSLLSQFD
jgi:hypothetical protein